MTHIMMKSWRRCSLHLQIQTTRGTREGVFFFGKFVVTHGASHRTVITAFSGETEYHSTVGLSALRGEADNVVKTMYIHVDATAVAGIAQTHVSCRMKHIAVKTTLVAGESSIRSVREREDCEMWCCSGCRICHVHLFTPSSDFNCTFGCSFKSALFVQMGL